MTFNCSIPGNIRPICLPFVKEFNIQTPLQISSPSHTGSLLHGIVAGWGKLYNSDTEGSPDLQYLAVPITDNVQCGKAFKVNNVSISELQVIQNTCTRYLQWTFYLFVRFVPVGKRAKEVVRGTRVDHYFIRQKSKENQQFGTFKSA